MAKKVTGNPVEQKLKDAAREDFRAYGPLADWYEEQGRPMDAARARDKAGLTKVRFIITHLPTNFDISGEYHTQSGAVAAVRELFSGADNRFTSHHYYPYKPSISVLGKTFRREDVAIRVLEYVPRAVGILGKRWDDDKKGAKDEDEQ